MPSDHRNRLNHVCIFGVGGVGGFFGGKLASRIAEAGNGESTISFVARGEHLNRIRKDGLILNTAEQQGLVCRPTMATDTINDVPPFDLCLLCVKSYDLEDAVVALTPKISDHTIVIPLLNGVDIYHRIRSRLSGGIVLPACVYVGTHIEKPGTVSQAGGSGIILCGEDPAVPDWNPSDLRGFFDRMKISFQWHKDPFPAIWEKFVFIAAYGLVTADSGKTIGEVFSDTGAAASLRKIMTEITAIAEKQNISLPAGIVEASIAKADNFRFETKTSLQRDVEQKGKRDEGDLFGGAILRLGEQHHVPTPETRAVYERIQGRRDR